MFPTLRLVFLWQSFLQSAFSLMIDPFLNPLVILAYKHSMTHIIHAVGSPHSQINHSKWGGPIHWWCVQSKMLIALDSLFGLVKPNWCSLPSNIHKKMKITHEMNNNVEYKCITPFLIKFTLKWRIFNHKRTNYTLMTTIIKFAKN